MSDNTAFFIRDQYLLDLSFESQGPKVFRDTPDQEPEVALNVHVTGGVGEEANSKQPGYHIDLTMNITASLNGKTGYIIEIKSRCEFDITDESLSEEEVRYIVLSEVPRFMFPFMRQEIARITAEGGFAPLRLMPITFSPDGVQTVDEEDSANKSPSIH